MAELVNAFDKAAWENRVYPLDNRDRIQKFSDLSEEQKRRRIVPAPSFPELRPFTGEIQDLQMVPGKRASELIS
ncbi:MAG: hypothetical protein F7B06_12040 [Opitutae bacterium]|nr:hypothetical protein [Opitutae bacterium]MBC9890541.1 hypothetical protein [Opitutae bacterium]